MEIPPRVVDIKFNSYTLKLLRINLSVATCRENRLETRIHYLVHWKMGRLLTSAVSLQINPFRAAGWFSCWI